MSSPTEPPDEWFNWYMPEDQEGAWQCGAGHMFRYEPPPASPPWCPKPECHAGNFRWIVKDEVTSKDWIPRKDWIPNEEPIEEMDEPEENPPTADDPDEERIESLITPHGIWQILPPRPLPDPVELSNEEQLEATRSYIKARYGNYTSMEDQASAYQRIISGETTPTEEQERIVGEVIGTEIHHQIEKHYTDMVHRNPDGPDPLVEEPGP
jgi:hypothetical protein